MVIPKHGPPLETGIGYLFNLFQEMGLLQRGARDRCGGGGGVQTVDNFDGTLCQGFFIILTHSFVAFLTSVIKLYIN